jgi:hypothetical protein
LLWNSFFSSFEFMVLASWINFAAPNGVRYWRWGGRGQGSGAEKTRSQKNA